MKDEEKYELMRVLKNLVYLAERGKDIKDYKRLKAVYNKMLKKIFENSGEYKKDTYEEEYEWDNARNSLDRFYSLFNLQKSMKDNKKILDYGKQKAESIIEAKERLNALKRFLK